MKILVIEDDPAIAQTLKLLLSGFNYAVDTTTDGESGLQMAEVFDYDLILLDMILPGIDGIGVCQQLRAINFTNPILLLTGQAGGEQKAIALNTGADDYVVKPFDSNELVARIQALLRRSTSHNQPMLSWGNLTIDPSRCKVNYGTHLLALTPKEYAILELFLRNPQTIYSSRMLLEHAWSSLDSPGEEAVRVHIKELRQKLTAAGAPKDFIKTIYRVGYQLNSLYSDFLATQLEHQPSLSQVAELTATNAELRTTLEQLQATQAQLRQKHDELAQAHAIIERDRQQLQAAREDLELRVAERTAELVQLNRSLQASEHRYIELLEASPVGIFWLDNEGQCTYVNDRWEDFTGRPKEAALGMQWLEAIHPEDRDGVLQHLQQVLTHLDTQQLYHHEARMVHPDGRVIWFHTLIRPRTDATGELIGSIGSLTDITQWKQAETAIQTSEENLQLALDLTAIGSWDWDMRYNTVSWNAHHYRLMGYEVGEVEPSYQAWRDRVHPDDLATIEYQINHSLATHTDYATEYRVLLPDGNIRWVLAKARILYDATGQPERMRGVLVDVSDRTEMEAQRQQVNLELREMSTALSFAVEGIARLDPQGQYTFVNDAYARILGYAPAEMMSQSWQTFAHPDDMTTLVAGYYQMQSRGKAEMEARSLHKDGSVVYTEIAIVAVYDDQQQFTGNYCFKKDISNRKRLEREQYLAQQKIQEQAALLDITTDAIFVRDLDNRILYWNQGAERLYGWSAAEAIGQPATTMLPAPETEITTVLQWLNDRGEWHGEISNVTKAGHPVTVAARWTLIRDEAGQPKSILTVDTDITQKKQLEAQAFRSQRLESLGTLAGGIAHDLNNVLTPILSIAQMLQIQKSAFDAQTQELLDMLERSAKRGANTVQQILTFTRGSSGDRVPLQVADVLREVLQVAQQTFPPTITIRYTIPEQPSWQVSADPTQLHQVFMNLCQNARDAMPEGGLLTLSMEHCMVDQTFAQMNLEAQVGNYVVVAIADTGSGIPPEYIDLIFDPFFTTKKPNQGTGLGLSMALGTIKGYGGFFQVTSEVGQGSQFKIYLPVIESATTGLEPSNNTLDDGEQGHGELILIADDDEVVQRTNQCLLENHDYRTILANDGVEAIAAYTEHQTEIKAVLLDMMMPNIDGINVARTLQKINPQVQIIATSGLSSYRKAALAAGAKMFLAKPYTIEDLLKSLSHLLHEPQARN